MNTINDYVPTKQYRFYYTQLNRYEQVVYDQLLDGVLNYKDSFECECSIDCFKKIYDKMICDIPELFYLKKINIKYQIFKSRCKIMPVYRFSKNESVATLRALNEKYNSFIMSIKSLSDFEKEKAIHDMIVSNVKYKDIDAPYSHEAPGALLFNIGVCDGISKAFKYLADRVNLNSIVVLGESNAHGNYLGHAWNMVELNNIYYHIDVTFDSTIADECVRYDYFNLSDDETRVNHIWEDMVPKCPFSYEYYKREGVFFNSRNKLESFLKEKIKREKLIIFQIPSFFCEKEKCVNFILEMINRKICFSFLRPVNYVLSYNEDRMVFQIKIE